MANPRNPIRITDDLASLPLPPEDLWVRARRGPGFSIARLAIAGMVIAALIVVTPPLAARFLEPLLIPSPAGTGSLGTTFDVTPYYPGYPWTRDGRAVKPEELGTIAGPAHCEWQSATFLTIGWPVGTLATTSAQARQYIRDPHGVVSATLRDRLEPRATLPSDARATGYTYGSIQVYLSPSDQDEAIYVVGPSGSERWPRSDPTIACS